MNEELAEFSEYAEKENLSDEEKELMEKEFGDLMFSLVNFSRFVNVDPEAALEKTNKKFIQRFLMMEEMAKEQQRALKDMTLDEMDALWNKAKEIYR